MPKIGLLGGTFNPVHLAHLRAAEEMREQCELDRVEFVLAAVPPHKDDTGLAAVEDRRVMLERALAGHPAFAINTLELERPGRSYSIDTIRLRQARDPDARLTFLVGADAFAEIESWKDFAEIFGLCDVAVMSRPGCTVREPPIAVAEAFCYDPTRGVYAHRSGFSLAFLPVTALMISASDIRHRCATGRSIRYLVPAAVEDYVREHQLYAGRVPAR
jgi:nicotinate-nucleotide adenylyltransferase